MIFRPKNQLERIDVRMQIHPCAVLGGEEPSEWRDISPSDTDMPLCLPLDIELDSCENSFLYKSTYLPHQT